MALDVELLYFDGCPNHEATRDLVGWVAEHDHVEIDLRLVEVQSPEEADRLRFLGSPSVRVNGHDIEPGAERLESFVLACRVYQTDSGLQGVPPEDLIRRALHSVRRDGWLS